MEYNERFLIATSKSKNWEIRCCNVYYPQVSSSNKILTAETIGVFKRTLQR